MRTGRKIKGVAELASRIFLVAAPRSGAGLVHQLLLLDSTWKASTLSNSDPLAALKEISSESRGFDGKALDETLLSDEVRLALGESETSEAGDSNSQVLVDYRPLLSQRIGLLAAAFPEAKFIHVMRTPLPAISSGMQAWVSGRFVTEPELPGWWGEKWSFGLVPQWKELIGKPLAEVVASQYLTISNQIIDDLAKLDSGRVLKVSLESLLDDPQAKLDSIAAWAGISWNAELPKELPLSKGTISKPDKKKWEKNSTEILAAFSQMKPELEKTRAVLQPLLPALPAKTEEDQNQTSQVTRSSDGTPFSSSHSSSFAELLTNAKSSLVITTYKSGHVILVRSEAEVINTSFKNFPRPMGIAVAGSRLAIGTADSILSFVNQPGLSAVIEPKDSHDTVYAPRAKVQTGDIAIHEMAYGVKDGKDDLWFVNTKFSCLCKQDLNYSFVPVWRPKWITSLAAEDRCHLNGMALVDGAPKYVSALSQTDEPNGWREHKGTSGVIIDVTTDEVIASGLSMPHSPRWHQKKLWILESGKGTLATVNVETGEVTTVATLPGFTRGLSFFGSYAFIGLSQVRESVFKSLPVTEQSSERNCGVWVVDVRSGKTVAILKFKGVVQEIFDVAVLPGAKWPTIIDADAKLQTSFVLDNEALKQVSNKPRQVKNPAASK